MGGQRWPGAAVIPSGVICTVVERMILYGSAEHAEAISQRRCGAAAGRCAAMAD